MRCYNMIIKRWIFTFLLLCMTLNAFSFSRIPDILDVNIVQSNRFQIDSICYVPTNNVQPEGCVVTQNVSRYEFRKYSDEFQIKIFFVNKDSLSSRVFHANEVKSLQIVEKNGSIQFVISSVPEKKSNFLFWVINILLFILLKLLLPIVIVKPKSNFFFISGVFLLLMLSYFVSILFVEIAILLYLSLEILLYISLNQKKTMVIPVLTSLLSSFIYVVFWVLYNFLIFFIGI